MINVHSCVGSRRFSPRSLAPFVLDMERRHLDGKDCESNLKNLKRIILNAFAFIAVKMTAFR